MSPSRRFVLSWVALGAVMLVAMGLWLWSRATYPHGVPVAYRMVDPEGIRVITETARPDPPSGFLGAEPSVLSEGHRSTALGPEMVARTRLGLRVVDELGRPIQGASIVELERVAVFFPAESRMEPHEPPKSLATSDANGEVVVTGEIRRVAVFAQGFGPELVRLDPRHEQSVTLEVPHGIRIVVVDTTQHALPEARILMDATGWGWPVLGGTGQYFELGAVDSHGTLATDPGPGSRCSGIVVCPGHCPRRFELADVDPSGELRVELPPCSPVEGRIAGRASDRPLYVVAERATGSPDLMFAAQVMASEFRLLELDNDTEWRLTPCIRSANGWEPIGESESVTPPCGPVVLGSGAGTSIRVRAIDREGGPLVPVLYRSLDPLDVLADASEAGVLRDLEGGVTWPELYLPTSASVWVGAAGHDPARIALPPAEGSAGIDLGDVTLDRALDWLIHTIATETEEPIAGVRLRFVPDELGAEEEEEHPKLQEVLSGPDGTAHLRSASGGDLIAEKAGWVCRKLSRAMTAVEAETVVAMEREASLTVVCETIENERIPGAAVQWRLPEDSEWHEEFTDRDGVAVIGVPPGEVELRYSPGSLRGFASGTEMQLVVTGTEEDPLRETRAIQVQGLLPGEERTVRIELPAMSGLEVLVTQDGKPVDGCRVVAIPGTSLDCVCNDIWGMFDFPRGVTDLAGRCFLDGVSLGTFTLAAITPRGDFVTTRTIYSDHRIEVAVHLDVAVRDLEVRVVDNKRHPVADLPLEIVQVRALRPGIRPPAMTMHSPAGAMLSRSSPRRAVESVTDSSGVARFSGLPQDAILTIRPSRAENYPTLESTEVLPGADASLEIAIDSGAALAVHLEDTRGAGLDGVLVLVSANDSRSPAQARRLVTRRGGRADFYGLHPGSWTIEVPSAEKNVQVQLLSGDLHTERLTIER